MKIQKNNLLFFIDKLAFIYYNFLIDTGINIAIKA